MSIDYYTMEFRIQHAPAERQGLLPISARLTKTENSGGILAES